MMDPAVVVVGSGEQYGRHDGTERLSETADQRPQSVYGATKAAQEIAAFQAWRESGLRVVCTRSFNHTGPGQSPNLLVPALVRRALALRGAARPRLSVGNTTPIRDFLHVEDVVRAYLLLADRGIKNKLQARPTTSQAARTYVGALATLVLDHVGVAAELEPVAEYIRTVDLPVAVGDSTKLVRRPTGVHGSGVNMQSTN